MQAFDEVKQTLLKLNATGEKGFEGLVAKIILSISGVPSRLAKSGTQFGIDGSSSFPEDSICFEAKRYSGKIPKDQVIAKIATLSTRKDEADLLWVLGATSPVGSQLADELRRLGNKSGISVMVLDWSEGSIPLLAVTLAMGGDTVANWLAIAIGKPKTAAKLRNSFKDIRCHQEFEEIAERIKFQFDSAEMATINAIKKNKLWFSDALSKRDTARSKLGQPICSKAKNLQILPRKELTKAVSKALHKCGITFVLGEEGSGKSWIASMAISEFPGISIFISAEKISQAETREQLQKIIVDTIISQSGGVPTEELRIRWRKRIEAWKTTVSTQRILVVVDGLNQRPRARWDHTTEKLHAWLISIGGSLILTCRNHLFESKIKPGLYSQFQTIQVGNWSNEERNKLLEANDISAEHLDPVTAKSLLNPRLLGIAIDTLPKNNMEVWQGLTTSRLLFEHIRCTQKDSIEPETADVLSQRLSDHASKALDLLNEQTNGNPLIFQSDTEHVAEGRFFSPANGPGNYYTIRDEGLTLALGYALVDKLWNAERANIDLEDTLNQLLEPVSALDKTADVVLAALTVCALDAQRFSNSIYRTIAGGFSNLQNPDASNYPAFRDLARSQFNAFLFAVEDSLLDRQNRTNQDWFDKAVSDLKDDPALWPEVAEAVDRWFSYCTKEPDHELRAWPKDDKDKYKKKIKDKKSKIKEAVDNLSSFEILLLKEMTEINGDLSKLTNFGMQLLAKEKLAPFSRSFLKWGVSIGINKDTWVPITEFNHLTNFNLCDWEEMCDEFHKLIKPLRTAETSLGGKRTLVRMLYATGLDKDAQEAKAIAKELRKDWPRFDNRRRIENYCSTDPCDPNSNYPKNIEKTARNYQKIDVQKLYNHMGHGEQDHFRQDALPGVARFCPEIATQKHSELLNTIPDRSDLPLRQVVLNGSYLIPLVSSKLSGRIIEKLKDAQYLNSQADQDKTVVGMFLLWFAFSHLTATQQLDAMWIPSLEGNYLLDSVELLKKIDAKTFENRLSRAVNGSDTNNIFAVLAFLHTTNTELTSNSIDILCQLISHEESRIRASAFKAAFRCELHKPLTEIAQSGWSFEDAENSDNYEAWYGSVALIEAAKLKIVNADTILARIAPSTWVYAASMLGTKTSKVLAQFFNRAFEAVIDNDATLILPNIEIKASVVTPSSFQRFSIDELTADNPNSLDTLLERTNESNEDFQTRHKHMFEVFKEFEKNLTSKNARLVLGRIDLEDFKYIANSSPEMIKKWAIILLSTPDNQIAFLRNFLLVVARYYGDACPEQAVLLFKKASGVRGSLTISYGGGVTLEHMAVWGGTDDDELVKMRFERLNSTFTDAELAKEVLAAENCGKYGLLKQYIDEGITSKHPYKQARALMVAGFCDVRTECYDLLLNYCQNLGLAGDAARAALYAYERHKWTSHWVEKMQASTNAEDFWINSQIFAKVVDGRFMLISTPNKDDELYWRSYPSIVQRIAKRRIEKWIKKREKTLFGGKVPNDIFV